MVQASFFPLALGTARWMLRVVVTIKHGSSQDAASNPLVRAETQRRDVLPVKYVLRDW